MTSEKRKINYKTKNHSTKERQVNTVQIMGNEASQEVDIRVKYPRCRFNPPPQIGGSSYSYANAYSYSWRNCIKKSKQNDPPDSNQSVYVRTGADALEFTECGNEQTGGYRRCVAQKWAQKDDNTAKDFDEKQVEGEIQENGPVFADFMIRKVKKFLFFFVFVVI